MKTKTNHTVFFKAMVLVLAFALAVLCAPIDALVALAQTSNYTDYSYMTIGKLNDEIKTTVTKGHKYTIAEAYISGDKNLAIGAASTEGKTVDTDDGQVTFGETSVTVKYSTQDVTNTVKLDSSAANTVYGSFVADKVGTYTITYAYEYELNGRTYTNKYELKVNSELNGASISFEDNNTDFIPSAIDLAQLSEIKESDVVTGYKNAKTGEEVEFVLPHATINDEDGEELLDLTYVKSTSSMTETGKYVLVSVEGGQSAGSLADKLVVDSNKVSIPMSVFGDEQFGAGKYTVTYALYEKTADSVNPYLITSTTKSFNVYASEEKYYGDEYKLKLELASSWSDNGQTGIETALPAAKGVVGDKAVDVSYKVKVLHSTTGSAKSWEKLDEATYNIAGKDAVIDSESYLLNPSSFKPLEDGYYTFVYTITDFYGNSVSTTEGTYEYTNISDEQNPTPVIYDASSSEVADEAHKLQSRSYPNGVVVYAIGIEDNVSKAGDEGVELSRKIMTSDSVTKLTISKFNDKNLVFNYRSTNSQDNAFTNLIDHNYVIAKKIKDSKATIASDADMLEFLATNNYMIVVDDANAETIYNIFNNDVVKVGLDDVNFFDAQSETIKNASADDKKAEAIKWLKSEAAETKGFAYVGGNETFGATTGDKGMGAGSYTIRYIAKDAAGNEKEISKSMYVGTFDDNTYPTIKFSTTLADTYLPDAKISFNVPTVSDNYDTNMVVKTLYRYIDADGKIITKNAKGEDFESTTIANLKADLDANAAVSVDENGTALTKKYEKFFTSKDVAQAGETIDNAAGYIELTDAKASTYSIDLNEVKDAAKLQIVTYAYDDCGNANIYAEEISIATATDNAPPAIKTVDSVVNNTYVQGQEIELPSFTVLDDAVSYMSYDVTLYYVDGNGKETEITTYDAYAERDIKSSTGAGSYTVHAGKFVAAFAGKYKASIAVKDSTNKTIVSFTEYEVESRNIVQAPVISTAIENKTVELDESPVISIPTPSISYEIPNSVTYDKLAEATADQKFVVLGVDENGKATNWSTTQGQAQSFKPTKVGEYNIQYKVKLTAYDRTLFTYNEMRYDELNDKYVEGGYFTYADDSFAGKIEAVSENKFMLIDNVGGEVFYVSKDVDTDEISVVTADGIKVVFGTPNADGSEIEMANANCECLASLSSFDEIAFWFDAIKHYNLESETYTIIAQDTKGPVLAEFDYANSMSKEQLAEGIKIYGIEATDVGSGINTEKSKIVISWKLANGDSGTQTLSNTDNKNMLGDIFEKESSTKNYDGKYTITYTVYDNNNNYTTKAYTIAVGDNLAPTITLDEETVADQYQIGSQLKINLEEQVAVKDGNKEMPNAKKIVVLKNTSTDKEIKNIGTDNELVFDLDDAGSYTLTIEVEDKVGNTTVETYNFEVVAKTKDTTKTYQIIGTVLIVLSVIVLAGVIVYFVVSKVKLDKELKK